MKCKCGSTVVGSKLCVDRGIYCRQHFYTIETCMILNCILPKAGESYQYCKQHIAKLKGIDAATLLQRY